MPSLDFSHIKSWVFDLDNTLYPASSDLFAQVDVRIHSYICRYLNLDSESAYRLQKDYFHEHGTTLNGLMNVHGMPPEEYLDYVHDIDVSLIKQDIRLAEALSKLSGEKLIFTNGTVSHAERVIKQLGVETYFDDIIDIVGLSYRPKPRVEAYDYLISKTGMKPELAVMFEDVARNLEPAHALGMTTVWIQRHDEIDRSHEGADGGHIHHIADNLTDFLHRLI